MTGAPGTSFTPALSPGPLPVTPTSPDASAFPLIGALGIVGAIILLLDSSRSNVIGGAIAERSARRKARIGKGVGAGKGSHATAQKRSGGQFVGQRSGDNVRPVKPSEKEKRELSRLEERARAHDAGKDYTHGGFQNVEEGMRELKILRAKVARWRKYEDEKYLTEE